MRKMRAKAKYAYSRSQMLRLKPLEVPSMIDERVKENTTGLDAGIGQRVLNLEVVMTQFLASPATGGWLEGCSDWFLCY